MKLNFKRPKKIIRELNKGTCIFVPTDTVCGLMCKDQQKIYELKQRDPHKKIVMFVADASQIKNLDETQELFLEKFWPGGVTVIKDGVSYRAPYVPELLSILKEVGPVYCSSANLSNEPTADNWKDAKKIFKNQIGYIVNTVDCTHYPSSIVDIDMWSIIRKGGETERILRFISNNKRKK